MNYRWKGDTHGGLKAVSASEFESSWWCVPKVRPKTLYRSDVFFAHLDDRMFTVPSIRSWKRYRKNQYKPIDGIEKMTFDEKMSYHSKEELLRFLMKSPLAHHGLVLEGPEYTGSGAIPSTWFKVPSLDAALHESSHMLDFFMRGEGERIFKRNFDFWYPHNEDYGDSFEDPQTTRALHLEARTAALQMCLMRDVLGLDVTPHERFYAWSEVIAGKAIMPDAFHIPQRRGVTRLFNQQCTKAADRYHRLREENAPIELVHGAMSANSRLTDLAVKAYRQDRIEYAIKHMVKYYHRLDAESLLATWHEMFDWISVQKEKQQGVAA